MNPEGKVDPQKLDAVGRLGGNWYVRASGSSLFEVDKPLRTKGIGVDQIPKNIRLSKILSGNDLGMLGNVEALPEENEIIEFREDEVVSDILNQNYNDPEALREKLHQSAKEFLSQGKVNEAWLTLLQE